MGHMQNQEQAREDKKQRNKKQTRNKTNEKTLLYAQRVFELLIKILRWLPRVLRPRAKWVLVFREILNPREVHAKIKTKMASLFCNIVRLKLTKLLEFWLQI